MEKAVTGQRHLGSSVATRKIFRLQMWVPQGQQAKDSRFGEQPKSNQARETEAGGSVVGKIPVHLRGQIHQGSIRILTSNCSSLWSITLTNSDLKQLGEEMVYLA